MTETREWLIPHSDLHVMSLTCKHCGGITTIDIRSDRQRRARQENRALKCGVCQEDFDSALRGSVLKFHDWLHAVEASGQVVTFRIPSHRPIPPADTLADGLPTVKG